MHLFYSDGHPRKVARRAMSGILEQRK
jgi:hypothetical protein